jgi:hypothetical protein
VHIRRTFQPSCRIVHRLSGDIPGFRNERRRHEVTPDQALAISYAQTPGRRKIKGFWFSAGVFQGTRAGGSRCS